METFIEGDREAGGRKGEGERKKGRKSEREREGKKRKKEKDTYYKILAERKKKILTIRHWLT